MPDAFVTRLCGVLVIAVRLLSHAPACADVAISSAKTRNMTCSAGVCTPTATDAVLNVGDLETLLASGNVEVTTTGSGIQANNVEVKAALSWFTSNTLTLEAFDSIAVARHVSVKGQGGLTLVTNNGGSGGTFSTGHKGRISFANLSSALTINSGAYTLVNSVKMLASAIAANAAGNYALADNYDASNDGIYSNTPVTTYLYGTVEGLGNTVSYITVVTENVSYAAGLFLVADSGSVIENLSVGNVNLSVGALHDDTSQGGAGLVITNEGLLLNDHVSGNVYVNAKKSGGGSVVGGLVATNQGTISNSYSTVRVGVEDADPGGLVGDNFLGYIVGSYATGSVTGKDENGETPLGALASANGEGSISDSLRHRSGRGRGRVIADRRVPWIEQQ